MPFFQSSKRTKRRPLTPKRQHKPTPLPPEIIISTLKCHDTLSDLHNTDHHTYDIFRSNSKRMLLAAFYTACSNIQGHNIAEVISVLKFALRQKLVLVEDSREMLTEAWQIFRERQLEASLVFLALELATLYQDDCTSDL